MVATVRCEEIANEKLNQLQSDKVLIHIFVLSCFASAIFRVNNLMNEFDLGLAGIGRSCSIRSSTRFWGKTEFHY